MNTSPPRRAVGPAALGAVALLLLTACAGGGSTPDATGDAGRELTNRAPGGTEPVDSVVWNLPTGEPATLDPRNAATYSGAGVVSNLCDPLLAVDEEYNLGPNIVSYDQVSDNQAVLTLAAAATFWNGNPVTTEDVAFSLERAAAPESVVSFIYANVASVEVTSDTEVTVNFTTPDVLFMKEMATFAGMVVEKAYAEEAGENFGSSTGGLMCSGPYELVDWVPGDHIELKANEDYWNDEVPLLADVVTFEFITDSSASTQAMTAGEIDGSYEVNFSAISALDAASAGELYVGPSMQWVAINIARPDGITTDPQLREAFQLLIDRQQLADAVFEGAAAPLYWSVTPRTWPTDQIEVYQESYDKWAKARAHDIEAAKALVEHSEYSGEVLKLAILAGDDVSSKVAQLFQQQAKQAGIEIEIAPLQPLDFAEAGYDAAVRERLGIDLLLAASFNAAQEPLEPMGFTLLPDAFYNYTGFDDPRVTELIQGALGTFDDEERARMTVEALDIAEADGASIPLVSLNTVTFLNERLGGAITSFAYMSMPSMAYVGGN